jgi:hypothetical protein
MEEYKMILRHKNTQEAFMGYDSNINKTKRKEEILLNTTRPSLRKRLSAN